MGPIAKIIGSYFRNDKQCIVDWLHAPNIRLSGKSPDDMLANKKYYTVLTYCVKHMAGKKHERTNGKSN